MAFTGGQLLVKATGLTDGELEKMSGIKGVLATKLGRLLVDEYKADKTVLDFKEAEKLKSNKKVFGKPSLTYTVEVDGKVKAIEFCVQSAKKEVARVQILGGLDKLDKGATVVNLQKGDDTMDSASLKQAKKFNGPGSEPSQIDQKLKGLNTKKRIVLCGHGGGADVSGDEIYTADEFGGKKPDEIVKFLIKKGLSSGYDGTIYLSGCHTAAGFKDPKSFASQVHSLFAKKGYKSLSVAGTPGVAYTNEDGSKGAVPSVVAEELERTITKSKKLLANLEKALTSGTDDQQATELQMKGLEDQYVTVRELILEMPPEARDMLEEKLLKPIKTNRDELAPALKEMLQSNKSLTGAVKSEKDYLAKLEKMAKEKKKMTDGKIDFQKFFEEGINEFNVDEWWGIFGPAKATSVKVKKKAEKTESLFQQLKNKLKKKETVKT